MIRFILALAGGAALLTSFAAAAPPTPAPRTPAPHTPAPRSPAPRSHSLGPPAAPPSAPASFDLGVWTVHASSIDANFKSGDFSTPAKVVMTRVGGDVIGGSRQRQLQEASALSQRARRHARLAGHRHQQPGGRRSIRAVKSFDADRRSRHRSTARQKSTRRSATCITCRRTPSSTLERHAQRRDA